MLNFIKSIFKTLGRLSSIVWPYKLFVIIGSMRNYFFSGYIHSQFRSSGVKLYIQSPLNLVGGKYIAIGDNFHANSRLRIEAHDSHNSHQYNPEIFIGNDVAINYDCHIACINKIYIGNGVLIASKVFITDHYHGKIDSSLIDIAPNMRSLYTPGEVRIDDNVWIGENVSIMPNVMIGKNCIVGANSVVTKSFPANSIIAGVPAKLIKTI